LEKTRGLRFEEKRRMLGGTAKNGDARREKGEQGGENKRKGTDFANGKRGKT